MGDVLEEGKDECRECYGGGEEVRGGFEALEGRKWGRLTGEGSFARATAGAPRGAGERLSLVV